MQPKRFATFQRFLHVEALSIVLDFEAEPEPYLIEHDRVQVAADLADAVDDAVNFVGGFGRVLLVVPDNLFERKQFMADAVVQVERDAAAFFFYIF